jgi:hypothetical protein
MIRAFGRELGNLKASIHLFDTLSSSTYQQLNGQSWHDATTAILQKVKDHPYDADERSIIVLL